MSLVFVCIFSMSIHCMRIMIQNQHRSPRRSVYMSSNRSTIYRILHLCIFETSMCSNNATNSANRIGKSPQNRAECVM